MGGADFGKIALAIRAVVSLFAFRFAAKRKTGFSVSEAKFGRMILCRKDG